MGIQVEVQHIWSRICATKIVGAQDMANACLVVVLSQCLVARIQCCQNTTVRSVTCQKKTCHTTPFLKQLHALAACDVQYAV